MNNQSIECLPDTAEVRQREGSEKPVSIMHHHGAYGVIHSLEAGRGPPASALRSFAGTMTQAHGTDMLNAFATPARMLDSPMIIRLHDCPLQSWKNGLGRTREIAVHPGRTGSDDFCWRVSVAEVDTDAPFSRFPGIDRQIVLLEGNGFTMRLDDDRIHVLNVPLQPFAFAGEAAVMATLIGGETRDFNLMVRRSQVRGSVLPWHKSGVRAVGPEIVLVYCADGVVDTDDGPLHAGDAWLPSTQPATAMLQEGASALAVRIDST